MLLYSYIPGNSYYTVQLSDAVTGFGLVFTDRWCLFLVFLQCYVQGSFPFSDIELEIGLWLHFCVKMCGLCGNWLEDRKLSLRHTTCFVLNSVTFLSSLLSSSRSRSRSRSHSPSYRNYPTRDYQNNRGGFRGYNRGYRRPYHYRGRNRGYYPRGHYQNRGGGGYGYKANWQGGGGGWHDRHHDQDHHSHSPRRGRSRTPKKRSGSRSRSRNSDRSSSGRSRRSRRSSYSSRSRSSSPRHRSSKSKPGSKDAKLAETKTEKSGQAADGSAIEKASGGKWIDYDTSPKRPSPDAKKEDASTGSDGKGPGSGGPLWKTIGNAPSPTEKSPTKSGQTASFGGFGFFSKEDAKAGDKTVISAAFKKYVCYFLSYLTVITLLFHFSNNLWTLFFFQTCSLFQRSMEEYSLKRRT